jgi:hypothetical protein
MFSTFGRVEAGGSDHTQIRLAMFAQCSITRT